MAKATSLTKGSVMLTATRIVTVALGYALNVYLARSLGPASFGLFATVLTVLSWLELAVAEGLPPWVIRVVDRESDRPLVPRTYVLGQLAIAIGLSALLAAAAPLLANVFGQPETAGLFRVAAIDIPLFGLYTLFWAVLIGTQSYGLQSLTSTTYSLVKLAATVLFVGSGLAVLGAVMGGIAASIGGLALVLILILVAFRGRKLVGGTVHAVAEEDEGFAEATKGGVLAGSIMPAVLFAAQSLVLSSALWLVKAMLPPADAGYFHAANLVAQVPFALSSGIVTGIYAAYSDAQRRGDLARQRHYITQATRLLFAAGVWCIAMVVPTATALLQTIFSDRYTGGGPVLVVLIVGTSLGMLGITLAPVAILEGRGWTVLPVAIGLVVTEVAVAALLVPRLGVTGAALPAASVFVAASVIAFVAFRDKITFPTFETLLRLGLPAVVVGAAGFFVRVGPGLPLIGYYVVASLAFAALLFASKGLTRDDVDAVRAGMR